jgi:hypothetical protein
MPNPRFPQFNRNDSLSSALQPVMSNLDGNYLRGLTYEKWLRDTAVSMGRRGEHLQALDQAIREYCTQRFDNAKCLETTLKLQDAFARWALRKAGDHGIVNPGSVHEPQKKAIWSRDRRNHSKAITRLYDALYTEAERQGAALAKTNTDRAEREAIEYMEECTRTLAAKLFFGKTCQFRFLAKTASAVVTRPEDRLDAQELQWRASLDGLSASAGGGRNGLLSPAELVDAASDLVSENRDRFTAARDLFDSVSGGLSEVAEHGSDLVEAAGGGRLPFSGDSVINQWTDKASAWLQNVLMQLVPKDVERSAVKLFMAANSSAFGKVVKKLAPVIGPAQAIGSGLSQVAAAKLLAHRAKTIEVQRFTKGETAALAIEAIVGLMRDQAKSKRNAGLRETASATAQTVISLIPGAQLAGTSASLTSALIELIILFKEFMEDKATRDEMNRYLQAIQDPEKVGSNINIAVGRELFEKYPLLAAYWVMIAETSSVIGLCAEDLTAHNFMQQVEQISRGPLERLRTAAAELIAESSLVIPELSAHRLIVQAQSATPYSTRLSTLSESIKRSVRGWTIYRRAAGAFPAPAWKDRIVGISNQDYFAKQDASAS